MKLETFFEKFDELADTPDGIKKTRELVLRLATTGHLIPTDGSGWAKVALNEIASARMGKTILKNELSDSGIPVYSAGRENTAWGFIAASDLTFRTGTIVVSARGTIGFPKIPAEAEFISTQTTIAITPTSEEIDSGYFCLQLQTVNWDDLTAKTAIPMITVKQVHAIEVRYPHSLAEQKRIVAKVDELMALCDRLEAQQQEREAQAGQLARASLARFTEAPTPANLNHLFHSSFPISPSDLRKSILTLAVQGKLVPQDAEPSFLSLESILAEASVNGVSKGPTFDKSATEILRISAGTSRGDFYVNEDDFKHVDLPPDEVEKFQLAPGDLLACRFNGNLHYVGRFSYYRGESGRVQVNPDKLIRFRIKTESHCPRYVCLAMNAAPTREAIEAMCATTAGNIGLSAGRLKTVEIPIPPLAEQRRIVAKVSEVMALVDELETQLAASRAAAEKLLSALVAELTVTTSRLPSDS
jgi:type I restriction enzyme S subunit